MRRTALVKGVCWTGPCTCPGHNSTRLLPLLCSQDPSKNPLNLQPLPQGVHVSLHTCTCAQLQGVWSQMRQGTHAQAPVRDLS